MYLSTNSDLTNTICDYNDIYSSGAVLIYTESSTITDYSDLASWQATGNDLHSVSVDPSFTSTTDLHLWVCAHPPRPGIKIPLPCPNGPAASNYSRQQK